MNRRTFLAARLAPRAAFVVVILVGSSVSTYRRAQNAAISADAPANHMEIALPGYSVPPKEERLFYDAKNNLSKICFAPLGSPVASKVWQIQRLRYGADGRYVDSRWSDDPETCQ